MSGYSDFDLVELLHDAECAACQGPVDSHGHRAVLLTKDGQALRHLVCAGCWASDHSAVAARVQLYLAPIGGTA